ncbi:PEP-CTERM motif protein [Botrimarina colliarenosi]|uniref:PEP-CTERM motif protein n=1 Tax=Botrimarina colliarenosi TaxID=2528001 RepID=A0A5C5ZZL7_9BACT|nr:PEP-CTERM sorting domain-containing protein [Botrimarina colliarenosi]TWT91783.1 PEP-CTERM motif protein [Botrimarina colliarenosi]
MTERLGHRNQPGIPMNVLKNAVTCCLLACLGVAHSADADVLLLIDVTNPSAVTIQSTDGLVLNTVGNGSPVDLADFFTADTGFHEAPMSGDLSRFSNGELFTVYRNTSTTLQLFSGAGFNFGEFTAGQLAFNGTGTLDLSALSLPGPGATGDINGFRELMGTWQVVPVPEPSSLALLGLGGLMLLRRRKDR